MESFFRKKIYSTILLLWLAAIPSFAQSIDSTSTIQYKGLLDSLLRNNPELFRNVLEKLPSYEVQIIYTRIFRDAKNKPTFKSYTFQLDTNQYFNPASTVKLPTIALALEKANALKNKGVSVHSSIVGWGKTTCHKPIKAFPARRTLSEFVKRMLLVSDNDGYNRLYDFVGQAQLNRRMREMGYPQVRIIQKFMPCTPEGNRHTPAVTFYKPNRRIIYRQPAAKNKEILSVPMANTLKGKGYYSGRYFIKSPYSFKYSNNLNIQNLHDILKSLLFPKSVPAKKRFKLQPSDYDLVRKYLCKYPRESGFPAYHRKPYHDSYKKYLMYGQKQDIIPDSVRIFNIVGLSYGFQIDCAYIVNFEANTEFMVSAVINVNQNQIYNDGVYQYGLGFKFLKDLGNVLMQYEKVAPKKHAPDLSEWKKYAQ